MQNSRWARLCLLILLCVSLTACDQVVTQLDQLMKTGKQMGCAAGKDCGADMADEQELNWFLREVKKP